MNHMSFARFTHRQLAHSLRVSCVMLMSIMFALLLPVFAPAAHAQSATQSAVVAWGDDALGQGDVPEGVNDAIALAAGTNYSLALKRDGTVVAWGEKYLQTQVPTNLTSVVAIAGGMYHSLAVTTNSQ